MSSNGMVAVIAQPLAAHRVDPLRSLSMTIGELLITPTTRCATETLVVIVCLRSIGLALEFALVPLLYHTLILTAISLVIVLSLLVVVVIDLHLLDVALSNAERGAEVGM